MSGHFFKLTLLDPNLGGGPFLIEPEGTTNVVASQLSESEYRFLVMDSLTVREVARRMGVDHDH